MYVGNLAPTATDQELRQVFQQYGEVVEVKLYRKGSYAFVQFARHEDAVNAIVSLNGKVRLSSIAHSSGAEKLATAILSLR